MMDEEGDRSPLSSGSTTPQATNNNEQDSFLREPLLSTRQEEEATEGGGDGFPRQRRSRNVPVTLWFQGIRCAGEAVWYSSVLSAYVFLLRPDNKAWVGYLSAIEGVAQFFAAAVAGFLADDRCWRRDKLLRITFFIGVSASTVTFLSSYYRAGTDVWWWSLVAVAPVLWGVFDGIGLTASLALFADSIRDGHRSYYFTLRTIATTGGQILGPLVALAMFAFLGDRWTIGDCSRVICAAQFLLIPAFLLLWFFNDDDVPTTAATTSNAEAGEEGAIEEQQEEQEHLLEQGQTAAATTSPEENDAAAGSVLASSAATTVSNEEGEQQQAAAAASTTAREATAATTTTTFLFGLFTVSDKDRFIAVSAAASDITCALAQGLSFRYYALFLLDDLGLHPVMVQVLDATACIVGSILLLAAQRLSVRFGRCPVAMALKLIGVCWLVAMTTVPTTTTTLSHYNYSKQPVVVCCASYVLQNSFLGSTQALTRSLVMDHVPAGERSKWSALESINIFGWCGSAAIGGTLVEHVFGGKLIPVFWLTAIFQVVGLLPLVPVTKLEPREREVQQQQRQ